MAVPTCRGSLGKLPPAPVTRQPPGPLYVNPAAAKSFLAEQYVRRVGYCHPRPPAVVRSMAYCDGHPEHASEGSCSVIVLSVKRGRTQQLWARL